MACCFALCYDTSALAWPEATIADAIIKLSEQSAIAGLSTDVALEKKDFTQEMALNKKLSSSAGGELQVVEYAPRAFKHLRELPEYHNNISHADWVAEWKATMDTPKTGELGAGRSGATFIRSHNNHFMIKNIDKKEVMVHINAMEEYVSHNLQYSFLMRHLMLFRAEELTATGKVRATKYLLVFENIADVPMNMGVMKQMEKWDLKGRVPKPGKLPHPNRVPQGSIGKDKDLLRDFRLSPELYKNIVGQLQKDTQFLQRHNLMDYSLFICIYKVELPLQQRVKLGQSYDPKTGIPPDQIRMLAKNNDMPLRLHCQKWHNGVFSHDYTEIFFMGIIDILTDYHALKKLANCCKQFAFFEQQLSTIPADPYGDRFLNLVNSIFRHKPMVSNIVGAPSFQGI